MITCKTRIFFTGWILTLVALLLCPVSSFKRLQDLQIDEDLTFVDEEDDGLLARSRRDDRYVRQSSGFGYDYDDEDNDFGIEGSGYYPPPGTDVANTYRTRFRRSASFNSMLADTNSQEFKNLKATLDNKFSSLFEAVAGEVSVHVISVGSARGIHEQEITMDITHIGPSESSAKIQSIMENTLNSRYMDTVPGSLTFNKVEVTCGEKEIKCDGNLCIPLSRTCDQVNDCRDGEDELGKYCPKFPTPCGLNEYPCRDGSCIPNFKRCDQFQDCPDNDDEEFCRSQQCPVGHHRCGDGSCILIDYKCDGKNDCHDESDEKGCTPTSPPECKAPEYFQCHNGVCINGTKKCDGINNCQDKSDETNCPSVGCPIDQFRCDDGQCLNMDSRCNGYQDCINGEDERSCSCRPEQFKCDSGMCIEPSKKCDGHIDCPLDSSDEANCPPVSKLCLEDQFQCTNGQCIVSAYICDGLPDCNDGSDEMLPACSPPASGCSDNEFQCSSGDCVELSKRCDAQYNCLDQSDEAGCPPATRECGRDELTCGDGTCISITWKCDSVPDCLDGSDEIGCTCKVNEFACGDGLCISESLKCDQKQDCSDGSDEHSCPCTADEFSCRSGECISFGKYCNVNVDCSDGSDEEDCGHSPSYSFSSTTTKPTHSSSRCAKNFFECALGQCIPSEKRCDGNLDCLDMSDESDCPAKPCEPLYEFTCDSGECIESYQRCNNQYDCPDASDELDCSSTEVSNVCSSFEFKCKDGECISSAAKCDGFNDCFDRSDENDCPGKRPTQTCSSSEYTCSDGTCISSWYYCDGRLDCRDGSDEENCNSSYPLQCLNEEFQCNDGHCISSHAVCDGVNDCLDYSDESNCRKTTTRPAIKTTPNYYYTTIPPSTRTCRPNEFRCRSGECIFASQKCDQRFDCSDRSDEHDCPTSPPPPLRCPSGDFQCQSGECIDTRRQCDQYFDCRDRSDESNCPTAGDFFTCGSGEKVRKSRRCDGFSNCLDGSDEISCACENDEFQCKSKECVLAHKFCDGVYDCLDRSDEIGCGPTRPTEPSEGLNLRTYPDDQTIKQSGEVVFQCRDEGPQRKAVRWVREGGQRLPPGSTDIRGRLTIPNIQVEHSGTYICEAQGVPSITIGKRKPVTLIVDPFISPTLSPRFPVCSSKEAVCYTGECIPKDAICDQKNDCSDGSDESRCDPLGCEPNEFQCDNKMCVGKAWICDSDNDCGDESDERNCDGPLSPGSNCTNYEFTCNTFNQCIPRSFHCDNEIDCQDRSDEVGCSKPIITEPPKRMITLEITSTFEITCRAIGMPIPIVVWRLNWGHVPVNCTMTSVSGYGVLTCVNAQLHHQGAYSCEAINSLGSVFAEPDAIVQVKTSESVCSSPMFNSGAIRERDCLQCFCFGITNQCHSSGRYISQFPPPTNNFQIVGANQNQFQGNYVIRDRDYPLSSRYLRNYKNTAAVKLDVSDRNRLGGPSDLLIYFALPETHRGPQLNAYGGYLRYSIDFENFRGTQLLKGPDVIIRGNNVTIMHVHDYSFVPGQTNKISVRFWTGQWYKKIVNHGGRVQSHEPATRFDIATALEDIELFLIRASYTDGNFIDTTLRDVQLDTAVYRQTDQGLAVFVEECRCPVGYSGMSCEDCAQNYKRIFDSPYLGRCELDVKCNPGEYGDPANGIPCLPCPCPHTNDANRFGKTCILDHDGQVTCSCQGGYQGRRCEYCAEGYEGNPNIPDETCQRIGECDPNGSLYTDPDITTGMCQCKENVIGPKCTVCQAGSFYLDRANQYGCIECFCMGITNICSSSNWYRSHESMNFISSTQGMQLVDQYQRTIISNNILVDSGKQELIYRGFSDFPLEVYYWKLPQKFLGDKIHSYGGNLTFSFKYIPTSGGQSSKNNAYDVEIYGNDVSLRYYHKEEIFPGEIQTMNIPLYEQNWQRQDGQEVNREHFLMALADLEYILIKGTYTTNTIEVGLKDITMSTSVPRNTGQDRAFAVEMCECPEGYRGLSCEDCGVGFKRGLSGTYLGDCERCECNGHSHDCDPDTGVCFNCRSSRAGDVCENCAEGYYEKHGQCVRLDPCSCDQRGSVSSQCYNNQCKCKDNVEGDECNTCKEGNFYLSENNSNGCLKCWCSGVTDRCSSSQYYRELIPMNLFPGHGFTLSDRHRTDVINADLEVSIESNKITFSQFDRLSAQTTYYWSLPQIFTGNHVTSYGGILNITQQFDSRSVSDIYADADVIITSSNKREFIWMNKNTLKPRQVQTYEVNLKESEFTVDQRPATREEFLAALSKIEAILVRAQLSVNMVSSSLQYVTMDTAVDYPSGRQRASEVEQCSCPSQYIGFSCEECALGFYRDTDSISCVRCPCNGKEDSCYAQRNGVVQCNCLPGYTGVNCGVSVGTGPGTGGTGVLEIYIVEANYEAPVGATVELACRIKTRTTPRPTITWDKESGTLPYGRASDDREGLLTISQVRPEDAGTYVCRASQGYKVVVQTTELIVTGGGPPSKPAVIIDQRQEINMTIGQHFEVRCRASGSPQPNVQWQRADGRAMTSTTSQHNGILVFSSPSREDSGRYICSGRNTEGATTATITIYIGEEHVPVDPVYIIVQVSEEDVTAAPGSTVRVTCSVPNSQLRATFTWTKVESTLPPQAIEQDGVLIIPNAKASDSGLYTCRVTDFRGRFGEKTTRIVIEFAGNQPVVRIEPDRQAISLGETTELRCVASGVPSPTLQWSKVNEELSSNVRINGAILRIENAAVSDRGRYVCTAVNDVGRARASASLEVERREPPVIEIYPKSRETIEKGYSAMFQCYLTGGIPTPTVSWARADGRPLTSNTVSLSGGVLRFNQVTGDEEGSYICTAINDAGKITATATLEVQSVPKITMRPYNSPHKIQAGSSLRLECSAEGDPHPIVKWQKITDTNTEQDVPVHAVSPSSSVFEIKRAEVSDGGTYQCVAQNAVGSGIERIQVLVEDNLPTYRPVPASEQPGHSTDPYQVPLGGEFQFKCFVEGSHDDANELMFDFERADGRPLPRQHTNINGVLTVSNVEIGAAGEYACIVRERVTSKIRFTIYATLEVVEQPRVRLEPARQVVRPGENVYLRCIVTGAQPITINWSKESGRMPPSVVITGGELLFRGIETTDTGRYICEAVNSVGRGTSVAEVIVNEMPLLTALQEQMTVSEGQNVVLRCEASGVRPASVKWSRDSASLPRNAYPSGTILKIQNVQPINSGRYKCEARTPTGVYTYDFINLNVRSSQLTDIRIIPVPNTNNIRVGHPYELFCNVQGDTTAKISWTKLNERLPYNAENNGNLLKIPYIQPNDGGVYVCNAITSSGVFEKHFPLVVQNTEPTKAESSGHDSRSVKTRSIKFGSSISLLCGAEVDPPVSYTWTKQNDKLPLRSREDNDSLFIPDVEADDAGTYVCKARNDEESEQIITLLIVTGIIPRFAEESYLALPTLPNAYLSFDLEISFKPEKNSGLILYNSQRDGPGDFISFGLKEGYAEFLFDVGSGPAIVKSTEPLELGVWHTAKLGRNRKEGTLIIDGGMPVTGKSVGRFQGLDLINPLYVGGVPDFQKINTLAGYNSGFEGCVSRLVIGIVISELMRDARVQHEINPCDTCSLNPCNNDGVCQEAYSQTGHKCICPAGFSGDSCESTGESCYPGVCGTGRCENTPEGLECFCPFGTTGIRCEHNIAIEKPSFSEGAFMAYSTPRALKRFSLGMDIKPETMEDGILMYCGQQERGDGDFTSLAIRNKKVQFKYNTGTGTATLESDEIIPGEWIKVHANRTDKVGSLQINGGEMQNTQSPGNSRSLNLRTPLFIGGVDSSKIKVAPDVEVEKGFRGCISEIIIMDQAVNMEDSVVESANVEECGVLRCTRTPCKNGARCEDDSALREGYSCHCSEGFSGRNCEVKDGGVCLNGQPCHNGGVCKSLQGGSKECLCPLLFAGDLCEEESYLSDSAQFNKRSWIEIDRYLLPQDGISDQTVSVTFSTSEDEGVLLWHGHGPSVEGRDKDYFSLAIVDGFLKFAFSMEGQIISATTNTRVNDGNVHTVNLKRSNSIATLQLDNYSPIATSEVENIFSFNTPGNIYLGGTPDLRRMTNNMFTDGFTGCIHNLTIGSYKIDNFMNYALTGINVTPCSRRQR